MLVKFSCGCIGLTHIQGGPEGRSLIIHPCDLNHPECWEPLGLTWRDMHGKGHEPLAPEEAAELVSDLDRLIREGYALRRVRGILASK